MVPKDNAAKPGKVPKTTFLQQPEALLNPDEDADPSPYEPKYQNLKKYSSNLQ